MIRIVEKDDTQQICDIYNYYVENSTITFEEDPVSISEMKSRIGEVTASLPWLVYEKEQQIIGYAYASKWKGRCAYRFSVESTVYIKHEFTGNGVGKKLYEKILADLHGKKIHAVIGGIAMPNVKSQQLHEKLGFTKVAHFSEVGYKFSEWIDVGYWQLILSSYKSV